MQVNKNLEEKSKNYWTNDMHTSSIQSRMTAKNFQWYNKWVLIKIRIDHSMTYIGSTILRGWGKKRVLSVKSNIGNILWVDPEI